MSDQGLVETRELPTFIKKKHELDKLFKLLEKASPAAVKLLTDTMEDTEIAIKTRIECAKELLGLHQSTVEIINADEMARLIAEFKIGDGASRRLTAVPDGGKPAIPALNFEDVREVGE